MTPRTRAILDRSSEVYLEVDSQGLLTEWNFQAEKIFGWARDEVLGLALSQLIVPERNRDRFALRAELRVEITACDRDGHEFQIQLTMFSVGDGLGIFAREVARVRRAADEAERLHRDLMDQLAEPYIEVDLRGRFVFVNKSYCEVFGVPEQAERTGVSYKDALDPRSHAAIKEAYEQVYRTGRPQKVEYPIKARRGAETYVESSVALRRDAQGQPVGFMAFARDLSARKRYEDEMAIAKDAAEAASRAKGEFLANMSHEVRTPLNGVIGMLELARQTALDAEQSELIEMAAVSASSLLGLINDILDFSKIEAGKLQFDSTEFDLTETVAQTMRSVAVGAQRKGLELTYSIAPEVPCWLLGDPMRLAQVLINLLGNAIKFTPKGQVALRVALDGEQLRFSVSDTGIGMKAEKLSLIFDAFSQADASTTRVYGGTGLGLTICSRIVKLMGGEIWVESEPGKGSTFYFTAKFAVADRVAEVAAPERTRSSQKNSRSLKILLAEDNLINQKLTTRLLNKLGHSVSIANNGQEALEALEAEAFELVLMDVQMPEMDGFTAASAIRAKEAARSGHIPIVALTADAMTGDKQRCLEAGMDDYVVKPIHPAVLRETIERVLAGEARRTSMAADERG